MKEYVLWALPEGSDDPIDQKLLLSGAPNMATVNHVIGLASKDGFHSFRVQTIDLEQPFDAGAAFAGSLASKRRPSRRRR